MGVEWTRDGYVISDERDRLDLDVVHAYLHHEAYWAKGVTREVVDRSIAGSLCYGLYAPGGAQAGFARLVTDQATYAWLADVFILPAHRGKGLGVWLVGTAISDPRIAGVRRVVLATADAHEVYRRFGFAEFPDVEDPARWMVLRPG